ncbi:MAG: porin family protein [Chitinophagaceae bacterium]|nr:porin family protein [Chitinophagaceae bacterium]
MKKIAFIVLMMCSTFSLFAQEEPVAKKKKDWSKVDITGRSADHFLLQFGYNGWGSAPDSINTKGFSRTFNFYLMFDFPFKTNPRLSVAIGPGIGTDNMFFDKTRVDIVNNDKAKFIKDTITDYKKFKVATGYLELPVELRFSANPENMNKGFKFAIGAKVGTLLDAKTKAKVDRDANGFTGYIEKEKNKKFFNGTRLAVISRVGMGNFSLFASYTITDFFKQGSGPEVRPFSFGITLSGL